MIEILIVIVIERFNWIEIVELIKLKILKNFKLLKWFKYLKIVVDLLWLSCSYGSL